MAEHVPFQAEPSPEVAATEAPPALRPRIYVASLSDYNAGRLHGDWLDANQEPEELSDQIRAMLERSREPGTEEWAIHDHDDFGGITLSEFEELGVVSRLAAGLAVHGPAFGAFAAWHGHDNANSESFEQHYRGHWDSAEAYADDLLRDLGAEEIAGQIPAWIRPYLRLAVAGFARDLALNGDLYVNDAAEGGVYVFDTVA